MRKLVIILLAGCLIFAGCQSQNAQAADPNQSNQECYPIELPLFPKRQTPIVIFCEAVLCIGGLWLSDYGMRTLKHSDRVADLFWFVGWAGGILFGLPVLLTLLNALTCK